MARVSWNMETQVVIKVLRPSVYNCPSAVADGRFISDPP